MDWLDRLISGYAQDTPVANPVATLEDALTPQSPEAPQPMAPAALQPDNRTMAALTLLNLAGGLARNRAVGQSRLSHALDATNQSLGYGMALKKDLLDQAELARSRAIQAEKDKLTLATGQVNLESAKDTLGFQREMRPLQMERERTLLENAKTDSEVKKLEARWAKLRDAYADDMARYDAELAKHKPAAQQAAIAQSRSIAAENYAKAQLLTEQANAFKEGLKAKEGFKPDNPNADPNLGELMHGTYTDKQGRVHRVTMPLPEPQALTRAAEDWKVLEKAKATNGRTKEAYIKQQAALYTRGVNWDKVAKDQETAAPAAPAETTPAPRGQRQKLAPTEIGGKPVSPNEVLFDSTDGSYWVVSSPGKPMREISKAEYEARKRSVAPTTPEPVHEPGTVFGQQIVAP